MSDDEIKSRSERSHEVQVSASISLLQASVAPYYVVALFRPLLASTIHLKFTPRRWSSYPLARLLGRTHTKECPAYCDKDDGDESGHAEHAPRNLSSKQGRRAVSKSRLCRQHGEEKVNHDMCRHLTVLALDKILQILSVKGHVEADAGQIPRIT